MKKITFVPRTADGFPEPASLTGWQISEVWAAAKEPPMESVPARCPSWGLWHLPTLAWVTFAYKRDHVVTIANELDALGNWCEFSHFAPHQQPVLVRAALDRAKAKNALADAEAELAREWKKKGAQLDPT